MATTLAFVFTDAAIGSPLLSRALRAATDQSFNIATVDGETSTNDTILVMASAQVARPCSRLPDRAFKQFQAALQDVLRELAEMIVADGEGAEHVADVEVRGTASDADARKVAQRIATSLLVKTAMHGKDPNWGRILSAAGMAGVKFDPDKATIHINDVQIVKDGCRFGSRGRAQGHGDYEGSALRHSRGHRPRQRARKLPHLRHRPSLHRRERGLSQLGRLCRKLRGCGGSRYARRMRVSYLSLCILFGLLGVCAKAEALALPCRYEDALSEAAAELMLSGQPLESSQILSRVRALGFDGVAVHAHEGQDEPYWFSG